MDIIVKDCKYRLPCNCCDKYDRPCAAVQYEILRQQQEENIGEPNPCEHNWVLEEQEIIKQKVSYKRYKCRICGKEKIIRIEFQDDGLADATSWEKT